MGRKSTFKQEIADEICERIATGEPLIQICLDKKMPAYRTVYDWLKESDDFATNYARARDIGYDLMAENQVNIASGLKGSSGDVQRDKLMIETNFRLLKAWKPSKYGDRVDIGNADGKPFATSSDDDLRAELAALRAKHGPDKE